MVISSDVEMRAEAYDVLVSSLYYDDLSCPAATERLPANPQLVYAFAKLDGDVSQEGMFSLY